MPTSQPEMTELALRVNAVSYAYPDGQQALHDVSFAASAGEAVALIGGNGAGKSTLALHLNGFLQPSSGSVHVFGCQVSRDTLTRVRQQVGMVFQDPDDQLFMASVAEDVGFGPLHMGLPAQDIALRVQVALQTVGAEHLAERAPHRLSGGEKRMIAIAGVLAMAPSILVLDEPSAGLDPAARRRLIHLLQGLPQTKLIATHDLDLVLDLCTRVLVLHHGQIEADATPAQIFADTTLLARCHLEPPLSQQRRVSA